MAANLWSVADLTDTEIRALLDRAAALERGADPGPLGRRTVVGLCFLTPSLRTRVGFAVAAHRLGCHVVDTAELRWNEGMSAAESLTDTLRTVAGMVDVLVVRSPEPIAQVAAGLPTPVVNAGDAVEHPTQALLDLLAIEEERGPVSTLDVAMVGDLTMRAACSLLGLFDRFPPARLRLCAPAGRREHAVPLSSALLGRTEFFDRIEVAGADVAYVIGLPEGTGDDRLDSSQRGPFVLKPDHLAELAPGAVVLSPLPVIDELTPDTRADDRIRMFQQSDRGVYLRMAVLEALLVREAS